MGKERQTLDFFVAGYGASRRAMQFAITDGQKRTGVPFRIVGDGTNRNSLEVVLVGPGKERAVLGFFMADVDENGPVMNRATARYVHIPDISNLTVKKDE